MSEATMNGRPNATTPSRPQRKQLSDQLDRMDSIVDALAEGLPEAVAAACKEGAREALKEAIIEIVTNPEIRALLTNMRAEPMPAIPAPAPEAPRKPSRWERFKAKIATMRDAVCNRVKQLKDKVVDRINLVGQTVNAVSMAAGEIIPVRRMLVTAVVVGLVVGIACLLTPQKVAATVSAVTSASTAIAVQFGIWLKRAVQRFGLVT